MRHLRSSICSPSTMPRATFFPVGEQVADGAAVLRRAVADGHAIGNHTWRHDRLAGIAPTHFESSVVRTHEAVRNATGVSPTCLRPPGGAIDAPARANAAAAGM
jgi:peptidoglycan/xylan/chitin deacetylase (PgdA/CDA1 family)